MCPRSKGMGGLYEDVASIFEHVMIEHLNDTSTSHMGIDGNAFKISFFRSKIRLLYDNNFLSSRSKMNLDN